jgi:1,4-alpha-glucan branching enzyme
LSSRRWTLLWLSLSLVLLSGCSFNIIKNRLPAPFPVEGGIQFQYEAPAASLVTLAGNWEGNWWGGTASPSARYDNTVGRMSDPDGDGIWKIIVDLPPGRYMYKFVIDNNTWTTDPNNPSTAQEGGFTNSLIVVK